MERLLKSVGLSARALRKSINHYFHLRRFKIELTPNEFHRAKRYERMMKAHGIAPNAAAVRSSPAARPFKAERYENNNTIKKRKVDEFANDRSGAEDDQERFDNIKPDPSGILEELHVKEEPEQHDSSGGSSMHFFPSQYGSNKDILSGCNMYDPKTSGFNTHTGNGNAFDFSGQSDFMNFNGYGQSDTSGVDAAVNQVGDHKQGAILIGD